MTKHELVNSVIREAAKIESSDKWVSYTRCLEGFELTDEQVKELSLQAAEFLLKD